MYKRQRHLNLNINAKLRRITSASVLQTLSKGAPTSVPLLIYFHGGGWVTTFKSSDMQFLSEWAHTAGCPILYVEYSVGADNPYPTALDECCDVYVRSALPISFIEVMFSCSKSFLDIAGIAGWWQADLDSCPRRLFWCAA